VQLGRFLIDYAGGHYADMSFDEAGRIADFGYPEADLERVIQSGKPFQTSGCPGKEDEEVSACNRPYGDSPPSDIRSFPFALDDTDVELVRRQMAGEPVRNRFELEGEEDD
jgi:biotin synthase